jgi:hypothetical protein
MRIRYLACLGAAGAIVSACSGSSGFFDIGGLDGASDDAAGDVANDKSVRDSAPRDATHMDVGLPEADATREAGADTGTTDARHEDAESGSGEAGGDGPVEAAEGGADSALDATADTGAEGAADGRAQGEAGDAGEDVTVEPGDGGTTDSANESGPDDSGSQDAPVDDAGAFACGPTLRCDKATQFCYEVLLISLMDSGASVAYSCKPLPPCDAASECSCIARGPLVCSCADRGGAITETCGQ